MPQKGIQLNNRPLTENQIKLIELIVDEDMTVTDALKETGVKKSTYYYWLKHNRPFIDSMDEMVEIKVKAAKDSVRMNVERYINRLDKLSDTGKNEVAKVNAIAKLFTMAGLDPQHAQEINVNHGSDHVKNKMLELLKQEQEKDKQEE